MYYAVLALIEFFYPVYSQQQVVSIDSRLIFKRAVKLIFFFSVQPAEPSIRKKNIYIFETLDDIE